MSLKAIIVISLVLNVLSREDFLFMKESALKIKEAMKNVYCNASMDTKKIGKFKTKNDEDFLKFLIQYNQTLKDVQKAINKG